MTAEVSELLYTRMPGVFGWEFIFNSKVWKLWSFSCLGQGFHGSMRPRTSMDRSNTSTSTLDRSSPRITNITVSIESDGVGSNMHCFAHSFRAGLIQHWLTSMTSELKAPVRAPKEPFMRSIPYRNTSSISSTRNRMVYLFLPKSVTSATESYSQDFGKLVLMASTHLHGRVKWICSDCIANNGCPVLSIMTRLLPNSDYCYCTVPRMWADVTCAPPTIGLPRGLLPWILQTMVILDRHFYWDGKDNGR